MLPLHAKKEHGNLRNWIFLNQIVLFENAESTFVSVNVEEPLPVFHRRFHKSSGKALEKGKLRRCFILNYLTKRADKEVFVGTEKLRNNITVLFIY